LFYIDNLSEDCKLYLSSKHVTLSCLYLLSTVHYCGNQYSYVWTQWHCTV